ncbi:MAG: YbjQ family protein [Planctomycetota bacterium]
MLDREGLQSGTRPEIAGGRILLSSAEGFDGYEITQYMGMCWGISVRAKDLGQDMAMGCKQITGGELTSYTELGDEARTKALDRMLAMAKRQQANAVINVRFELEPQQGVNVVTVWGTACIIKPVRNYVPTGAMGNIVAEIHDVLAARVKG